MPEDVYEVEYADGLARPQSRVTRRLRAAWGWVKQLWYWDGPPTPGQYRQALDEIDRLRAVIRRTEVELAVATADRDAAVAEMTVLALVVKRNEERVKAETAEAVADRERATNSAAVAKQARHHTE